FHVEFEPADVSAHLKYNGPGIPPLEYDHPYDKTLILTDYTDQTTLHTLCAEMPKAKTVLGSTKRYADRCEIWISDRWAYEAVGVTRNMVIRHELGHCNGWPDDHPGAR